MNEFLSPRQIIALREKIKDLDTLIEFCEKIPEDQWCTNFFYRNTDEGRKYCFAGLLGARENRLIPRRLIKVMKESLPGYVFEDDLYPSIIVDVNDGSEMSLHYNTTEDYVEKITGMVDLNSGTPKSRVLDFLNKINYEQINMQTKQENP